MFIVSLLLGKLYIAYSYHSLSEVASVLLTQTCADIFSCVDIELRSDTSLAEAVQTLSKLKVLSAPVVDVDAPEDASWIDRYIGIVEFPGIVVWLLHQVSVSSNLLHETTRGDLVPTRL